MIITTGKRVSIEIHGYRLERDCATPGGVTVHQTGSVGCSPPEPFWLPANDQERARFIAAYNRICDEDIEYRKVDVE